MHTHFTHMQMLAAGYETTANTTAFAIYLISTHKRVEAKLLEEIDAFGRERYVKHMGDTHSKHTPGQSNNNDMTPPGRLH